MKRLMTIAAVAAALFAAGEEEYISPVTGKPVPRQLKELRDLPVRFTRVIDIEEGMHAIAARMQEIANG